MRSRTKAVALVVAVVATAVASYAVGSHTESEDEAAARAAPVRRTVLTEPVRERRLTSSLVFRATVAAVPAVSLSKFPTSTGDEDAIVTKVAVSPGSKVRAGRPIIEVAGRPVIALKGTLPSYRDLGVGDSGPDVMQLQRALIGLGYLADDADGTYGVQTADAVAALWSRNGYVAPTRAPAATTSSKKSLRAYVVKGSIAYLAELPVTVASVRAKRGALLVADRPWASVRVGNPGITARIPAASSDRVRVGAVVRLYDDATGAQASATVTRVGSPTAASDGSGSYVPADLRISGTSPFQAGIDLRAVAVTRTTGRSVLSVPVVAVHTTGDGSTYVVVAAGSRRTEARVRPGLAADGYVEIVSSSPALHGGDEVVVSD